MSATVECEGAPRDLGRDQGLACAGALRARFAAEPLLRRLRLRAGLAPGSAPALRRELARHHPRQAEALAGIAAAARVPLPWLAELLQRESRPGPAALAGAASAERARSGARVGRALAGEWIVRRSRPEGGFRCVELTRPWLAHALLGVNEEGLAVAVSSCDPSRAGVGDEPRGSEGAALPAAPLATDCLQRFATLDACLDWCCARPGDLPATLLLADASGEIAGIEIAAGRRRLLRSAEGWLAVGGSREARDGLAKALRDGEGSGAPLAWAEAGARALRVGAERFGLDPSDAEAPVESTGDAGP